MCMCPGWHVSISRRTERTQSSSSNRMVQTYPLGCGHDVRSAISPIRVQYEVWRGLRGQTRLQSVLRCSLSETARNIDPHRVLVVHDAWHRPRRFNNFCFSLSLWCFSLPAFGRGQGSPGISTESMFTSPTPGIWILAPERRLVPRR